MSQMWSPNDDELARALDALGRQLAFPNATDLARRVRLRLEQEQTPARAMARGGWRQCAVLAVLALSVLGGALAALSPQGRSAIAQWLHLQGVVFLPAPRHLPPPGSGLHLGRSLTLAQAQARVPFHIAVPRRTLGLPDAVYVRDAGRSSAVVSLVYRARSGLPRTHQTGVGVLLTEAQGTAVLGKFVDPGTQIEAVTVGRSSGYWLTGHPHVFFYFDTSQQIRRDTVRLAGNVLLWNSKGLVLRLESALSRDAAIRIGADTR